MYIYPDKADAYLREATEALERTRSPENGDELKRSFVSFLNAARFSTQQLETEYKSTLPGFAEWWAEKGVFLKQDTLAHFFVQLRNDVIKEGKLDPFAISWEIRGPFEMKGPLQVSPDGTVFGASIKEGKVKKIPMKVQELQILSWDFKAKPRGYESIGGYELCQQYLKLLEEIIGEFIEKFARAR